MITKRNHACSFVMFQSEVITAIAAARHRWHTDSVGRLGMKVAPTTKHKPYMQTMLYDLGNKKVFLSITYCVHSFSSGCFHTSQDVRCDVRVLEHITPDTLRSMEASITLSRRRRPWKSFHNEITSKRVVFWARLFFERARGCKIKGKINPGWGTWA